MLLLLALLLTMKIRVGDGWTVVCSKKRQNKKNLNGKKDFGKRRFFNSGNVSRSEKERKEEELCRESKDIKEVFFQEDRSLRSGPKLLSQKKTPVFVVSSGSQPVKSGCGVSGPIFDPDVFVSGASFVNGRSTLPGFENATSMNMFLEGSEEELVLGDTPPDPSVFVAGPDVHTFKDASRDFHLDQDGRAAEPGNHRACSETLGVEALPYREVFQPWLGTDPVAAAGVLPVAGRAIATAFPGRTRSAVPAGSGRRALRAAKRAQASAPLECIDAVKGPDMFEQCFTPHRRVISSDSDLLP